MYFAIYPVIFAVAIDVPVNISYESFKYVLSISSPKAYNVALLVENSDTLPLLSIEPTLIPYCAGYSIVLLFPAAHITELFHCFLFFDSVRCLFYDVLRQCFIIPGLIHRGEVRSASRPQHPDQ